MTKSIGLYSLGLDIGGSSIKSALIHTSEDCSPETIETNLHEYVSSREPDEIIAHLKTITSFYRQKFGEIYSIGVGVPGTIDELSGSTDVLPNFPRQWKSLPFQSMVEEKLFQKITMVNDAKAFSVAESVIGAAAGFNLVIGVVLGTGVGGGIVYRGKIWKGLGGAGEFGHLTIEQNGPICGCGNHGCVESFASAAAISIFAKKHDAEEVFQAAANGDYSSQRALNRAAKAIGAGMANVFITISPDAFVIGGGIAESGAAFIDQIRREFRQRIYVSPTENVRIVQGNLGRHAGAIGAALASAAH